MLVKFVIRVVMAWTSIAGLSANLKAIIVDLSLLQALAAKLLINLV
jgi:hypothetical protein